MMVKKDRGVVLTQEELERIRAAANTAPEIDAAAAHRRYLKTLCDERVRLWPNTLQAQRQKKENWKRKQDKEVEARRRDVDREEALLQRRLRVETIKRANDKLYEQTDKMKLLRGNLLLAEVIETRADQVSEKQERRRQEKTLVDAYHRETMRKVAEGKAKEEALLEARKSTERAQAIIRLDQIKECQAKHAAERRKEKEEGDRIQREAKASMEAEKQEEQARKRRMRAECEKMVALGKDLQAMRADRIVEELADMEKCKQQRVTLDKAARARKSLEAKHFNEKQAVRQQMIDTATWDLEIRKMAADNKQEREAQEMRQKEDEFEAKKEQLRQERLAEIEKSRAIQIEQQDTQKREQRVEDERIKAYIKQKKIEMDQTLKEEAAVRRAEEEELRRSHQHQIKERKANELAMEAYEAVRHAHMLASQGEENKRFKKVVRGHMDDFESRGRPLYLLHQTLKYKNPIMIPAGRIKR